MSDPIGVGATHLLGEFVASMAQLTDDDTAVQAAVEHAAVAVEAEVGAVIRGDAVVAVGFPYGRCPAETLRAIAESRARTADLPGLGPCHIAIGAMGGKSPGLLLLGRASAPFAVDEINLVRAMARVLALSIGMMHTIATERALREQSDLQAAENARLLQQIRTRQQLVDSLSMIENAISRRVPLAEILDMITATALEQIGGDAVCLRIAATESPDDLVLVASSGLVQGDRDRLWRVPRSAAPISARALRDGQLVDGADGGDLSAELPASMVAAMSCLVQEAGVPVGALTVARRAPAAGFTSDDRDTLATLAEHVSLALTDARTVRDMRQALHDPLTGLPNRAMFTERLERELAEADRSQHAVGLLFIDLDRFKPVNDTLGHAAGDALLVEVAARLRSCLRDDQMPARFGGDEFAALLCAVSPEQAAAIADRITAQIRAPFRILGKLVYINASIGIAISAGRGQAAAELLRNADVAMYRAKRRGEGQQEIFRPAMHAELLTRLRLETDLSAVLDRSELVALYQPIVELGTREIEAIIALPYWRHPEYGLLPPEAFMALAEETGVISSIGHWLLGRACHQLREWQGLGIAPRDLYVTLSPRQLCDDEFLAKSLDLLSLTGLTPDRLVLKISAGTLDAPPGPVEARMRQLQGLGFRIALSEFGSGSCSLSDLLGLPVDVVKIDMSAGPAGPESDEAAVLRRNLLKVGQLFATAAIADGIDSEAHLARVRAAGFGLGQGPYLGAPADPETITATLMTAGLVAAGHAAQ